MLKMKSTGADGSDDGAGSDYSGSPKSTYSDRLNTFEEEDLGASQTKQDSSGVGSKRFIFPDEINKTQEDLPQGQRSFRHQHLAELTDTEFTKKALFQDFNSPDLLKTGYLIPLQCGHNGQLTVNERTIYEIHLTNAGFIAAHKAEDEE